MTNSFNPGNAIRADALNENFTEIQLQLQELEGSITNPSGTMKGPQGDRGIQGPAGPTGAAGAQGAQGPQGTQGTTGTQGVKGERGPQGEQGPQGQAGPQGPQGIAGPKGDQGTGLRLLGTYAYTGAPNTGTTGATPSQGDLWKASDNNCWAYSGTAWVNVGALAGATGPTGATGAAGAQGTTGAAGAAGAAGPAGAAGATGAQGPAGPAGAKGDTGATGATGPQGLQGATGLQGPAGVATTMGTLTDVVLASPGALDKLEYNGVNWVNVPKSDSEIIYNTVANKNAIPNFVVSSISLTAGGSGYSSVPTVTITNSSGSSGSGATATATINAGAVTGVTISAAGSGYSAGATVAFSGGGGTGATAIAVTNPTNGTGVEVTDSTGIESFTPMSGMPSGFVGDSGLTVRLQYTTTGSSSWKWKRYFASTSETRYASIAGETFTGSVNLDEHVTVKNGKEVRISEETANGSNYIALKAPASLSSNVTYQLPTDGNANEILKTDGNGVLSFATASSLTQSGITELIEDTTPELGGNLSVNNKSIISPSGNANINITPHGSGHVVLSGMEFPSSDGSANQILKTDGSNNLSWVTPYVHPNHTGEVTSTADGATVIIDDIVDEANLKVSNAPTNGQFLSAQSGNAGGLTWATPTDTDTTYTAGTGLTLTGTQFSVNAVALTTVQEAANESAQLALTAQEGDVVVRTDENKSYVHNGGTANSMADYTLLRTPTDAVLSVNGNTGAITAAQIATAVEAASDSNTFTDADHTKLNAIEASATADQTGAEIKTAYEAESDTNAYTDAEKTKLAGIEASATADQTNAEIRTAVEAASDSNVFTDADHTKLNAIEASATADQTGAEIKTAYEAESDTNAYTDAEKTKLSGIATSANNYSHPNHSGEVTSTADGATVIADDTVDEANLKISNAGSNGQFLQKQSGNNGGLTWADASVDISGKANLSGATFTGAIAGPSASFTDDGSAGPVINISGDDTNVWYGRIGNETYNTSLNTGFRFYVEDDGDVRFENKGNAEYLDWSIASHDGTTSRYDIYTTAAGAVYLYNSGNVRLTTTASGVTVTGDTASTTFSDGNGDLRKIIPNNNLGTGTTWTPSSAHCGHVNYMSMSGGVNITTSSFVDGNIITIVNSGTADMTITQGTGMTIHFSGDGTSGNRTLAKKGMCNIYFISATEGYISGAGLS